jgi:AcrR family transcriptional regulator
VSILPYRDTRRPRERQPLDRLQVVRAALALLDEVGLDGLTMRRLAERLGVKAASLYRHVRDKEDLLVLLADEISGEVAPVEVGPPWQDRLVDMAWRYRRVLLAHRDAARLLADTSLSGPRRLRRIDGLLELLLAAGFSAQDAVRAGYHFNNFVVEFVADEVRLAMAAEAMGTSPGEVLAETRRQLKALPAEEYPTLTRLADHIADSDSDGLFRFGLELWIGGLERLQSSRV